MPDNACQVPNGPPANDWLLSAIAPPELAAYRAIAPLIVRSAVGSLTRPAVVPMMPQDSKGPPTQRWLVPSIAPALVRA